MLSLPPPFLLFLCLPCPRPAFTSSIPLPPVRSIALPMSAAGGNMDGPVNCIETMSNVDWDDRIGLQTKWSNADKGWKVNVEWRKTPFGAGLFAAQDIDEGTTLRVGKLGLNLVQFHSAAEAEAFCLAGADAGGGESAYRARVGYVSDYLYGFNPNADRNGYALTDERGLANKEQRFFGMWIPGNGLNHRLEPNTVYRPAAGGTAEGIELVALTQIASGEQLFDDYRRHGLAPEWALDFARHHGVTLNFAECNDFVKGAE